jgi:hypothetical protein
LYDKHHFVIRLDGNLPENASMDDYAGLWRPLDPDKHEIRLLRLEPSANVNEWPNGSLEISSLNDAPVYEAISYAWGCAQEVHPLLIDGMEVPITASICGALRFLRSKSKVRHFWVDAICIAQRNLDERAQQVALMRRIFREASNVCVWLGHGSSEAEHVLATFQKFADAVRRKETKKFLKKRRLFEDDDQAIGGFQVLSNAGFWSRLWVTQEIVLARRLTIHYGDSWLNSSSLNDDVMDITSIIHSSDAVGKTLTHLQELMILSTILNNTASLADRDKLRVLLAIFTRSRRLAANDPRDRVFGLLGICASYFHGDFMVPSYLSNTSSVFTAFAEATIRQTGSLLVLTQASSFLSSLPGLPTWAPDWSSLHDHTSHAAFLASWNVYNACHVPSPKPSMMVSGNTSLLTVHGIVLADISRLGAIYYPHPVDETDSNGGRPVRVEFQFPDIIQSWKLLYYDGLGQASSPMTKMEAKRTFIRTLLQDCDSQGILIKVNQAKTPFAGILSPFFESRRLTMSGLSRMVGLYLRKSSERTDGGLLTGFDIFGFLGVEDNLYNKCFFVTSTGVPAIGPRNSRVGDFVAVLAGANMPFVLRKAASAEHENSYYVVGACYVDGIMDGQAVEGLEPDDLTEIHLL